jgi:hypothetical protein
MRARRLGRLRCLRRPSRQGRLCRRTKRRDLCRLRGLRLGLRPQRLRPRHFRLCRLLDLRFLRRLGRFGRLCRSLRRLFRGEGGGLGLGGPRRRGVRPLFRPRRRAHYLSFQFGEGRRHRARCGLCLRHRPRMGLRLRLRGLDGDRTCRLRRARRRLLHCLLAPPLALFETKGELRLGCARHVRCARRALQLAHRAF